MGDEHDLDEHERLDDGLRVAFGEGDESVLEAIARLSGSAPSRILLRDAPEEASPILRLAGPAEPDAAVEDKRYQILGEIARGGIGVVYKGRDKDLGRDVAVKVLRAELHDEERVVQRFVEEAQVGGQLQHPGIVPIYGLGLQPGGRPYFAMKLVKGETLAELLEHGEEAGELIRVFEQVAQTVAYAHSRGVIHRDLKPSNVMVGAFGEVQVVDWGFAKVLGREERAERPGATVVATVRSGATGSHSVAGSVMGTPAYMPPEQALGQVDAMTERSDVFSLGAVLCEILTGRPPYRGATHDQLVAAVQARLEEARGALEAADAPEALRALARECLQPLPKDRPKDAGVVAQRVSEYLAGVEDRARQAEVDAVHAAAEARRVQRARRTTIALAAVALLALLAGTGGYSLWKRAERSRESAATARVAPILREATRLEGEEDWNGSRAAAATALALAQAEGADAETLATARALEARIRTAADAAEKKAREAAREGQLIDTLDELMTRSMLISASELVSGFEAACARYGVDPYGDGAPGELSGFGRPVELALHLDVWAELLHTKDDTRWRAVDRLARSLDDDPWRTRLRDTAVTGDRATLRELASHPEAAEQHPTTIVRMARALATANEPQAAAALLRAAAVRYPGDFWIHYQLASLLWWGLHLAPEARVHATAAVALRPETAGAWNVLGAIENDGLEDTDGAIRAFRRTLALNPAYTAARGNLGTALYKKGDVPGALAAYREAIRLDPGNSQVRLSLGRALEKEGDLEGAVAAFREAIRVEPNFAQAHDDLGRAVEARGDMSGACAAYRAAIRLDPRCAQAHHDLAFALVKRGDVDGALGALRDAVRVDPTVSTHHVDLGVILCDRLRRYDEAIASFEEAIRLDPTSVIAHFDLGVALLGKGDLDGAVAAYRAAIRLDPKLAPAQANLGNALLRQGDRQGAVAAWREAIRLDPSNAVAYGNVGLALREEGDFEGSLEAFAKAASLDPSLRGIDAAVAHAKALAAASARLPAVLRGDESPGSAQALLALAQVCQTRKDAVSAARFYQQAFDVDPAVAADLRTAARYNAACVAALAGEAWHERALRWLWADLEAWGELPRAAAPAVKRNLEHWKADPDLASVRDGEDVPEAWRALWAEVDALLSRAEETSR